MSNFRFQFYILIAGLGVAAMKFYLFYTTKSNAVFSDALESLVNISANTITLYSLYLSAKPRDKTHPYGHGKIEFLAAGIEGGLLFAAGVITMVKSILDYLNKNELSLSSLSLITLLGLGFANYALGIYSERKGKKSIPCPAIQWSTLKRRWLYYVWHFNQFSARIFYEMALARYLYRHSCRNVYYLSRYESHENIYSRYTRHSR